jgi:hypothetical protein
MTVYEAIAYQHPRYTTGGESKKDHAASPSEMRKGREGRTLCGRPLGRWWFPRQQRFYGTYNFECLVCRRVHARLQAAA